MVEKFKMHSRAHFPSYDQRKIRSCNYTCMESPTLLVLAQYSYIEIENRVFTSCKDRIMGMIMHY